MREIKFRAWDKKTGKMCQCHTVELVDDVEGRPGVYVEAKDKDHVRWIDAGNYELMQFTGLLDKSGKEIYDGDIVLFTEFYEAGGLEGSREGDRQHKEKVYWDDKLTAWCVGDFFLGVIKQQDDEMEVISNIHANPELLTP